MILKEVAVTDYRSFAGTHRFDLEPNAAGARKRPIVLFGGLNGAGKTSLLTAVLLGLYGKQSLGPAVAIRDYHDYLANSIHKNAGTIVQRSSARIELRFNYARQGVIEEFAIIRAWRVRGKSVTEQLSIQRNGALLDELTPDQAQAFLNELIPIGVSALFFFDGEKIAELAEDDSGEILRHAVKKLLGLDIIERLNNDLAVFLRREKTQALPAELRKQISELETRMGAVLAEKDACISEYEYNATALKEVERKAGEAERRLTERGGQWAQSRDSEKQRQHELIARKRQLEKMLLNELAGAYPLAIAEPALEALLVELDDAVAQHKQRHLAEVLRGRLNQVSQALESTLSAAEGKNARKILHHSFADLLERPDTSPSQFDISDSQLQKYRHWTQVEIPASARRVAALKEELDAVDEELAHSSLRLERAPDEATLEEELRHLKEFTATAGATRQGMKAALIKVRSSIREAMELNRQIEALQGKLAQTAKKSSALEHARKVRRVLADFADLTAKRRINELERRFIESYKRLARKEDVAISAKIDPRSFNITLIDERGNGISKKEISAGEKQIYAIAILEALAKTSGRKLPLIIDTPLGRLDSHHRDKIVHNYLPQASHQVIVLSTDTEIDRHYYQKLQPEISHAYHLVFDQTTRSSYAHEGYFWPQQDLAEVV